MLIYHVINSLDIGGAENALKKLCCQMPDDVVVKVVVFNELGIIGKQLLDFRIEVVTMPIKSITCLPKVFFDLVKLFKNDKPDLVQTWLYHSDLIGGFAAKMAGIKNIIWSIRTTKLKEGAYVTATLRFFLSLLSHFVPTKIVCVANSSKIFHEKLGYSKSRLSIIGNGFEINDVQVSAIEKFATFNQLGITASDYVIGSVGRYSQDKGQDLFVNAAALVLEKYPGIKFLMVGRGNDENNKELVELIDSTGFSSNFILLGEQSDLARLYAVMDIFCLHSRTEGFPNVLGEAMMFGKPCVVTRAGDAELVLGNTGFVANSTTGSDIAVALNAMLDLPAEQRAELGNMARSRIMDNFSLQSVVSKYLILYKSLVVGS